MSDLLVAIAANVLVGAVAAWLLLRSRARTPILPTLDRQSALRLFHSQVPDAVATLLGLIPDAALFELHDGALGVLQRHGRRWNARVLQVGDIAALRSQEPAIIKIRFSDFGAPRLALRIDDPSERQAWLQRLRALERPPTRPAAGGLSHA